MLGRLWLRGRVGGGVELAPSGGSGTGVRGVVGVLARGRCEIERMSGGGGPEMEDSLNSLRGCEPYEGRRRGGSEELCGGPPLGRGGGVRGGPERGGNEEPGAPGIRIAPSSASLSRIAMTCSFPSPVIATISPQLESPSMRERTNPSSALRGSVRMSTPPMSSGTRWSDAGNFPSHETPHNARADEITKHGAPT
jgi:hypothetical protein